MIQEMQKRQDPENPENKAAKLTIIILVEYLPPLWRQKGHYDFTRVELHKLIMKIKKN